jgi:hypothetical protein
MDIRNQATRKEHEVGIISAVALLDSKHVVKDYALDTFRAAKYGGAISRIPSVESLR